jgi:hypothetical protein
MLYSILWVVVIVRAHGLTYICLSLLGRNFGYINSQRLRCG